MDGPPAADRKRKPFEPLKTGQVADILDWTPKKTRLWLDGLAKSHPHVLMQVNGRRRITLAALREVLPEFGLELPTDRDLDDIREEQVMQKREVEEIAKEFANFRRLAAQWYRDLARRTNALEKVTRAPRKSGPNGTE